MKTDCGQMAIPASAETVLAHVVAEMCWSCRCGNNARRNPHGEWFHQFKDRPGPEFTCHAQKVREILWECYGYTP